MFDVGFWELIILFGLGLIILGPERLPKVAMQIGNWAGQARRMARSLSTQIRDELDIDIAKPFDGGYTPPKKTADQYSRPGVDDLKPGSDDETVDSADHGDMAEDDADNDTGHADMAEPEPDNKTG
jgi:sec-independent protein translocase protein TatB